MLGKGVGKSRGEGEGAIEKGKNETLNSKQKLGNKETKKTNMAILQTPNPKFSNLQIPNSLNFFNPILRFFKNNLLLCIVNLCCPVNN